MTKVSPTELMSWDSSLGLPLGLEASIMMPNGVTFPFLALSGSGTLNFMMRADDKWLHSTICHQHAS